MFCRKCGIDNPDGARYCRRCGEPLTGARTSTGGTTSVPPTSGKMTVEDLPVEYRPIGMWGYFGIQPAVCDSVCRLDHCAGICFWREPQY